MSEHPAALAAMRDVIDQTGGSAGGTRDIPEAIRYRVLPTQRGRVSEIPP